MGVIFTFALRVFSMYFCMYILVSAKSKLSYVCIQGECFLWNIDACVFKIKFYVALQIVSLPRALY